MSMVASLAIAAALLGIDESMPIPVRRSWTGPVCSITIEQAEKITDPERWKTVWKSASKQPAPSIDFDKHMVLAVFGGKTWNSAGFEISEARRECTSIDVKLVGKHYQSFNSQRVFPFAFFIFDKSRLPLSVWRDVRHLKAEPPKWQLWKTTG